ncbi:MAG TPA: adenosylmethionine--8-amino-7-oxononanoate transaminase [Gemmatimonadaceae bacterium]|nr:adenosylmethionine--8-amino-7-oxononanoate transaminase [Gemmatimonadaceae bacterium]
MTPRLDVRGADRAHIWHPYTQHAAASDPIVVARASGAYLHDDAGRAIFDAISSWWVTLHGHANSRIANAIAEQAATLEQVIFAGFTHEPATKLAAALLEVAPTGLTRVFYSDDGSTAVEVAVKMAIQYWRNAGESRRTIVALEHAYHGDTFGAMSASARSVFTTAFDAYLFEVARLGDPSSSDVAEQFAALLAERERDIAAVIVEPMLLGAGGMRVWPANQLRRLRELTEATGIPLIADEVLTGFGRTGPLFACEHASISPDIMCLSKGLTGGFLPMGATLTTSAIFDRFSSPDATHTLFHGHSYTANPIACAAALASLELLDAECADRRRVIERAHGHAVERFRAHARVAAVRVLGTMFALDVRGEPGYLSATSSRCRTFALERGVLLRPLGNTLYLLPPYCATRDDLARAYDVIDEFLSTT